MTTVLQFSYCFIFKRGAFLEHLLFVFYFSISKLAVPQCEERNEAFNNVGDIIAARLEGKKREIMPPQLSRLRGFRFPIGATPTNPEIARSPSDRDSRLLTWRLESVVVPNSSF